MIKKECGSCQFYKASYSTSNGLTQFNEYGKCVKSKKKKVKETDSCPFYRFNESAIEKYRPSFLYEETFIVQLFTLEREVIKKHLSAIRNPLVFRISEEGEFIYKYDLHLLLKRLRQNHASIHLQRAEWFIKQQLLKYEKSVEQVTNKRNEFNLLR